MSRLKKLIISSIVNKNWHIRVKTQDGFSQIELTDPSYLWVNVDDLLDDVIELAFNDFNFLSISQFVDKDQWDIGEQDNFIRNVSNEFTIPVVLSRTYGTTEEVGTSDNTFVLNLIGLPEKSWLKKVVRFGMTNNPNILYGFHSVPENWFPQITEWNSQFRKWFELRGNSTEIETIVKQVDMIGWTEDGHFNIAFREVNKRNELLKGISKLADEKSLTPIIEHRRA